MRFLVDEAMSHRVAELLRMAGHDSVHVRDLGLLGEPDERIMAAAAADDRVVVSLDTDFGELLARGRHPGPSVLLLRKAPHTPEQQAGIILVAVAEVEKILGAGAVVVVVGDRIRVRMLPIDGS
jgi:predicted nuclease of predicted toxin-antitoxin system